MGWVIGVCRETHPVCGKGIVGVGYGGAGCDIGVGFAGEADITGAGHGGVLELEGITSNRPHLSDMEERTKTEDLLFGGSGRGSVLGDGIEGGGDIDSSATADDRDGGETSAIDFGYGAINLGDGAINLASRTINLASRTINLASRTVNTPGTVWDSPRTIILQESLVIATNGKIGTVSVTDDINITRGIDNEVIGGISACATPGLTPLFYAGAVVFDEGLVVATSS